MPQWDIAAATRVGDMYLSFVDDFRDAPVPPTLQGDDELVDIYYQGLDEASKPWVEKAKNAYEFCLITATKVRWFNEFMTAASRSCSSSTRAATRVLRSCAAATATRYSAEAKPAWSSSARPATRTSREASDVHAAFHWHMVRVVRVAVQRGCISLCCAAAAGAAGGGGSDVAAARYRGGRPSRRRAARR